MTCIYFTAKALRKQLFTSSFVAHGLLLAGLTFQGCGCKIKKDKSYISW